MSVKDEIDDKILRANIAQSRRMLAEHQASRGNDLGADYISGGTLRDAFWRTMLGNLIMAEVPKGVPKYYHVDDFESYVDKGTHSRLTLSLHGQAPNHAFFITMTGYIGIGSSDVRQGDDVCILGGGRVPFVIRSQDTPAEGLDTGRRQHHLICDAYVHSIMRGEAVIPKREQLETIELV